MKAALKPNSFGPAATRPVSSPTRLALLGQLALDAEALRDRCEEAEIDAAAYLADALMLELRREQLRHAVARSGEGDAGGGEAVGAQGRPRGGLRHMVQSLLRGRA